MWAQVLSEVFISIAVVKSLLFQLNCCYKFQYLTWPALLGSTKTIYYYSYLLLCCLNRLKEPQIGRLSFFHILRRSLLSFFLWTLTIDRFSLNVLFSHFRSPDITPEKCIYLSFFSVCVTCKPSWMKSIFLSCLVLVSNISVLLKRRSCRARKLIRKMNTLSCKLMQTNKWREQFNRP